MQTVCIVSSFLAAFIILGTLEWHSTQKEKRLDRDEPEYTGEFGKEDCKIDNSVISFQQSLRAYNRNN